jgi:hypothetical protein
MLDGGLGPLLHRASSDGFDGLDKARRGALHSADLTARVRGSALVHTAIDVVDTCDRLAVTATLLKGISTSGQLYPESHLRPMGDIDILVPAPARAPVEQALIERGYMPQPGYGLTPEAKHGIPLCHPLHRVWVEVHSDLVERAPPQGTLGRVRAATDSVPAIFHGRQVQHLRNELQLIYVSYAWMMDMARYSIMIQPSGLPPLLDLALLLSRHADTLDLDVLLSRCDDELALGCAYAAVTYLARRCPWLALGELETCLRRSQRVATRLNVLATHAMLDQYLLGAGPWTALAPPPVTGRYSIRYQWRKRLRKDG